MPTEFKEKQKRTWQSLARSDLTAEPSREVSGSSTLSTWDDDLVCGRVRGRVCAGACAGVCAGACAMSGSHDAALG